MKQGGGFLLGYCVLRLKLRDRELSALLVISKLFNVIALLNRIEG